MILFYNNKYPVKSRISCCGHLKTNLEHNLLASSEIHFSIEEVENPFISIKHKSKLPSNNFFFFNHLQ